MEKEYVHKDYGFHGEAYEKQSAKEKFDLVWKACTEFSTPNEWGNKVVATLNKLESLQSSFDPTFTQERDNLPTEGMWNIFKRHKRGHAVGCCAAVKFEPVPNNRYTGILHSGSQYAILRAATFSEYSPENMMFRPSIGIKFFRDNVPSANLVTLWGEKKEPNWNYLSHDFSNDLGWASENDESAQDNLVKKKSMHTAQFPFLMGLTNLSTHDEKGNAASDPVFPYRIRLQAVQKLREWYPSEYHESPNKYLCTIEPQRFLNVWAQHNPTDPWELIGYIDLVTKLTTSSFGDNSLFFKHERVEEVAFVKRPDWLEFSLKLKEEQIKRPFSARYPDLPYP